MSDDVTYGSNIEQPSPGDDKLRETVAELSELVRDSARRTAALDARIDSLPGPHEIASAVESGVEQSVREARDVIDARVGSLGVDLEGLSRRLAEVGDALVPLEGLRTEIATLADESAAFAEMRTHLGSALEQLAAGKVPTLDTSGPERVAAEVDARLENFRRLLDETASQIRSDFEVLVRGEQDASERRSDALGLRITNMSVGVTSTLEYLTQQAERIAERGRAIESENVGILNAIKDQVEAIRGAVPRTASDDGAILEAVRGVESRVRDIETRLSERMSSLEARVDRKPADGGIGEIADQLNAVIALLEAPTRDPMLQEVRDRLSSVVVPEPPARDPILDEMRAQLEQIASAEPATIPDEELKEIRAQLAELAATRSGSSPGVLDEIRTELFELRGELLELRDRDAPARDPVLDEIRARIDGLVVSGPQAPHPMLNEIVERLDRMASTQPASVEPVDTEKFLEEVRAHFEQLATRAAPARDPILEEIKERLERLASTEPAETDPILHEMRAQLSDLLAAESPRDPILDEIRAQLASLERPEGAADGVAATEAGVASAVERLRAALDEAVTTVQEGVSRSVGELSLRLDAVESKMVQLAGDTSDALDGAAAQTAGGMQDVRTALEALKETGSGIERIRQELFQAMESFSTQLVTRTAAVRTSISERTGRIEEKIASLNKPEDIVDALAERITPSILDASSERDEKIAGMEKELGGVASNVNEIWIRVRSIVKRMEQERAAVEEDAASTAEQIERLARSEERLGVRLMEAEQRLVQAMRAIETARDRIFLETLNDVLEAMPRRERKLFRRRVKDIGPTRGEPTPVPMIAPAATTPAPTRRFAPPTQAQQRVARAPEPARAKPKPKPKPRSKAKPKPRTVPTKATSPAEAAPVKAKPKPKPKPKAKPGAKAAPKPAPRSEKPAPHDVPAAPKPEPASTPNVDTDAADEAKRSPEPAPGSAPEAPKSNTAAEGRNGAETGA